VAILPGAPISRKIIVLILGRDRDLQNGSRFVAKQRSEVADCGRIFCVTLSPAGWGSISKLPACGPLLRSRQRWCGFL